MDLHIQIPSARRNINEQLREAILGHKCERAKELLADGADINHAVNKDKDTMLHEATTPYQVYCILGHGADVNTCNIQGKTPLHTAVETGKSAEVVEALISHCADINARDKCGNLPLNYAVRRIEKDYKVIMDLVMRGSLVMQHRNAFDLNCSTERTPLKDAVLMDNMKCVRALIKYHVLQRLPVAPDPNAFVEYFRHRRYNSMTGFYKKCCSQQCKMKTEVVHKHTQTNLLKVIQRSFSLNDVIGKEEKAIDCFANRCLWLVRSLKYSVYNDVILTKLEELLDHRCITNQIRELEIYTCVDRASPIADKKYSEDGNNYNKVIINADQQKSFGHLDKELGSSSGPKKWVMESYRRAVLNPNFQLRVNAPKNACVTFNSLRNDLDLTIDFQPQDINILCHKIVNQPQNIILNEKLNLNDVYDIGAGFNEIEDQPQNRILDEKLNLNKVYDIGAGINKIVDQPQNIILNEELNLNYVYDIGKGLTKIVDQSQKDISNEKQPDNSSKIREDVEKVSKTQNAKGLDNMEDKPFKRVVLNGDLVATIASYLGKRDLFNLLVAYYIPEDIAQEDEDEGSMDWWRKRILKRVAERTSSQPRKVAKFCL